MFRAVLLLLLLAGSVIAYVPARAVNGTANELAGGMNISDPSHIQLQWYSGRPNVGIDWDLISYQLVGSGSLGVSQGAFVHFSEAKVNTTTPPTSTPWVALISCESNTTEVTDDQEDVFTLARDLGAVSALLYSLYSDGCIINAEYADPASFDQVFDIFTTTNLVASQTIEDDFSKLDNGSDYYWYDSQRLNDSGSTILPIINSNSAVHPGYIFATLIASNATNASAYGNSGSDGNNQSSIPPGNSKSNTAVAMIILYAITGCVSALFCLVIVSGAVRAIRHPERYGPRSAGRHGPGMPQTRAQGLTRAILDTFPVVKFGSSPTANNDPEAGVKTLNDGGMRMKQLGNTDADAPSPPVDAPAPPVDAPAPPVDAPEIVSSARPRPPIQPVTVDGNEVMPAAIGKETCPICIVDFEEGDDLRQLPCEGKHRFHQQCVDPWLLELSSSCPICRHDFHALENMLSGESDSDSEFEPTHPSSSQRASRANRFSRYVRQAIRRRRQRDDQDPTTP